MGQTESKEKRLFNNLRCSLQARGIKVSASQTARFWSFGQEVCPWFLEEGSVNSDPRKRVGKQIKDFYSVHGSEKVPGDVFMLWGSSETH